MKLRSLKGIKIFLVLLFVLSLVLLSIYINNKDNEIEVLSFEINGLDIEKELLEIEKDINKKIIRESELTISKLEIDMQEMSEELKVINDELNKFKRLKLNDRLIKTLSLTDEEISILNRIVEAEATGGTFESKVNVANVIINRIDSKKFPNNLKDVVFQIDQFSPINDKRYYSVIITDATVKAVRHAISNEDTVNEALYFMLREHSSKKNIEWFDSKLEFVFKDGLGHEYFR